MPRSAASPSASVNAMKFPPCRSPNSVNCRHDPSGARFLRLPCVNNPGYRSAAPRSLHVAGVNTVFLDADVKPSQTQLHGTSPADDPETLLECRERPTSDERLKDGGRDEDEHPNEGEDHHASDNNAKAASWAPSTHLF